MKQTTTHHEPDHHQPDAASTDAASPEPAAIDLVGVTFAYPGAVEPAVEDVTLRVAFGERLGILGPNGGGKTTLIKLMLGLLTPSGGTVRICGHTPGDARRRGLIGYVPQRSEAELAFPLSVRQVVAMGVGTSDEATERRSDEGGAQGVRDQASSIREDEALGTGHWALGKARGRDQAPGIRDEEKHKGKRPKRKRGLGRRTRPPKTAKTEITNRIHQALDATGALALADHPIGTLSGGEVQRVMIARALAAHPLILILDEPTVGIDPAGQMRFADLLRTARERFGLTIVIVSHDVKAIAASCDRVACLSQTLHSHTAPDGLTPQVLAEVFAHDVSAVFGDVHVHAHHAADCTDPSHGGG